MEEVFRQEKKFLISLEEFYKCSGQLDPILLQDPNNGLHGYRIRSLYFDTPEEKDFFEKEEGVETRRKIRLRLYDPAASYAVLEMKQKQGMYQKKRSLRVSRETARRLAAGDYAPLLQEHSSFAAECYGLMNCAGYRPRAVVEYRRKAYIAKENKIRVTFDRNMIATESNFDLFSPNLPMYPVWDPYLVVMEVKYNGFLLSYIRELINRYGRSELSVSKYYLSRSVSLHYLYQ
ncbi:MAG TPA: polyphosphate polymerase domain-containing protein [Candidatus Caccousia avistercoris]|nr:polyphosphate polymerase domain-containing protein [Candidatus Caccousia avistercoris]